MYNKEKYTKITTEKQYLLILYIVTISATEFFPFLKLWLVKQRKIYD